MRAIVVNYLRDSTTTKTNPVTVVTDEVFVFKSI